MNRGDVVIAAQRGAYSGKPRPWLVIQNTAFLDRPASITVCAISTTTAGASFRIALLPDGINGLKEASAVLVDKVLTLNSDAVEEVAGSLDATALTRVDEALRLWLDL